LSGAFWFRNCRPLHRVGRRAIANLLTLADHVMLPGKKHRIVSPLLSRIGHTIVRPNLLGSVITVIVRNVEPRIFNTDLIATIARFPVGVFNDISVSERTT
jgi:hypothetical protein